ncbi:MAG TPA: low temperature requirement protein A, partial [Bauldia sp.]|nr:low temperature requirement protein A [Bauldia sp.]
GKDATATITGSAEPGRIGAYFRYIHVILLAGIIATAVGNDLVMAHPHGTASLAEALVLSAGPAIYLIGSAIYRLVVHGRAPVSHLVAVAVLLAVIPVALRVDFLAMGWITTAVMLATGLWEGRRRRLPHAAPAAVPPAH